MAIDYRTRKISVDEYIKMADVGILEADERVELLDGEIVLMPPIGQPHNSGVLRMSDILMAALRGKALVLVQGSFRLSKFSAPQPDFAVLEPSADYYRSEEIEPRNVLALIEVAQTSLAYDRGKKLHAYARAGVREYWIFNLPEHCLEVYRHPNDLGYKDRTVRRLGDTMSFAALPDVEFAVEDLLGPA
ncbi:MAG: Uma2 family endonuclease [Candidatus Eremiobacteraeota bacterium]|nr:Uma2 family endonuclease [Candidatus Eremiobacteraeota bacterium]